MAIRERVFNVVRGVFKRHGAVEIDTPVFELKETLTGKYGEDTKLIFDLADQGGALMALRYDLTVPFARYLALNPVGNIKRYHIAKVYRRDNVQIQRGRFREFYQCDFDVAGTYPEMVPDAEVITVACQILSQLKDYIGPFKVKLNHRVLLDAILDICGVPKEKFRPICSAIDKLDKMSWEDVKTEMVQEKGLPESSADKIQKFVTLTSDPGKAVELHKEMMDTKLFGDHPDAAFAMSQLAKLFNYMKSMGSLPHVSFDLSLARGLDYYTGTIYELVLLDENQVGTISAGGRYDKLVGMFSGTDIPCVGVSIGIERIMAIAEDRAKKMGEFKCASTDVLVVTLDGGLLEKKMEVCATLWDAGISAELKYEEKTNMKKALAYAIEKDIRYLVMFGKGEIEQGKVTVKDMKEKDQAVISVADVVAELEKRGCTPS